MPMHRKNSTKRTADIQVEEKWFKNRVERDRNRKRMAKASRKKNRSKK